jgi:hypothetical protein
MSAVKSSLLTILLCSCGGAPFDAADAIQVLTDAGNSPETSVVPETSAPEASAPIVDAGAPDVGLTLCTVPAPYECGPQAPGPAKPPYAFCMKEIGANTGNVWGTAQTVAPCNTCETYNCGCILYELGCRYPTCNEDDGGHVFVTCGR